MDFTLQGIHALKPDDRCWQEIMGSSWSLPPGDIEAFVMANNMMDTLWVIAKQDMAAVANIAAAISHLVICIEGDAARRSGEYANIAAQEHHTDTVASYAAYSAYAAVSALLDSGEYDASSIAEARAEHIRRVKQLIVKELLCR